MPFILSQTLVKMVVRPKYPIFLVVVDERERQRDVERFVLVRVGGTFA